jgi:hypothetical protein
MWLVHKSAERCSFLIPLLGIGHNPFVLKKLRLAFFGFGWDGKVAVKDYVNFDWYLWICRKKAARGEGQVINRLSTALKWTHGQIWQVF